MIDLPHKLSDLAEIALTDVLKVSSLPGYEVRMSSWHRAATNGYPCAVCAAGAVMVERFGLTARDNVDGANDLVERFGIHNGAALLAIDAIRRGDIGEAVNVLDAKTDPATAWYEDEDAFDRHKLSREMPDFREPGWERAMHKLISDLREAGL